MLLCADVLIEALPASIERDIYTYTIPAELQDRIATGSEVTIPFGSQTKLGYVVDLYHGAPPNKARGILDITGQQKLESHYLEWLKQISQYYLASLSQLIGIAIPRKLSARLRNLIQPQPNAVEMLAAVIERYGLNSQMHEFASYLISSAPQWKSRSACSRQFGRRSADWLQKLQRQGLVSVFSEVIQKPEARELLTLTLLAEPDNLSRRQHELLHLLREEGGEMALQAFCEKHHCSSQTLKRLAETGAISLAPKRILRRPLDEENQTRPLQALTETQSAVFKQIARELRRPSGKPMLLHGVTGSGKTEVYLHSLAQILATGHGGMLLVPEISLTPQMLRRCRNVFGDRVAVLHSGLSDGEYLDEWERVRDGSARIVVGARSAIFAPVPRLKLIIIDEEHESSYKQDSYLRYDARKLAEMRMRLENGLVIFGSATPRLEAYARARLGHWAYLEMPQRVHQQELPPVHVVDMRLEQARGNPSAYSHLLKRSLDLALEREEQAILLLNRRGYSSSWLCRDCGEAIRCPLCDVTLTFHQHEQILKCHYCEHRERPRRNCPRCQSDKISGFGLGTQKLEEITQRLFPKARILRLDRDTVSGKDAHTHILDRFGRGEADILIGTQMVAKGLDFPRVTLVGILAADQALTLPDFRASERTFQLLTQAAGRAGRSELPGLIVLQTYAPDHPAIQHALAHDYRAFAHEELLERKELLYPPYTELVRIVFAHPRRQQALEVAEHFANELLRRGDNELRILGPAEAPLARLQSLYRFHMLLKHPRMARLKPLLRELQDKYRQEVQRLGVDIDPYSML